MLVPDELKNSIVNPVVLLFVIVKKSPVAIFWPLTVIDGLNLNVFVYVMAFPPVPLATSASDSINSLKLAVTDKLFTKVLLSWSADVNKALNLKYLPLNCPVVKFWNELKVTLSSLLEICNIVLQFWTVFPSQGSGVPESTRVELFGLPVSTNCATSSTICCTLDSNLALNIAGSVIVFEKS